ncbi:hypothetical protein EI94DRAFT_71521 [Lactarius quietus]|nr:hypothetical protein EI94DRAFT_71521 [Lactarius quietus]
MSRARVYGGVLWGFVCISDAPLLPELSVFQPFGRATPWDRRLSIDSPLCHRRRRDPLDRQYVPSDPKGDARGQSNLPTVYCRATTLILIFSANPKVTRHCYTRTSARCLHERYHGCYNRV